VLRELSHQSIVGYDGFFNDELGRNYLVMEYVEGPTLAEVISRHALSVPEIFALRDRLVTGLGVVHAHKVVHRDISPDNIVLPNSDSRRAKWIDFGLSRLLQQGAGSIMDNTFAGKLNFVAPEQLGMYGSEATERSDIYSLGLVLAAAGCGHPLDMGSNYDLARTSRNEVPNLQAVPEALREQVASMLQPDPADRPQSVGEILAKWPAPTIQEASGKAAPTRIVPSIDKDPSTLRQRLREIGRRALPVAAAVAILALAAFLTKDLFVKVTTEPIDAETQAQIEQLLEVAGFHVDADRLTEPIGSNAAENYQRVLRLDPSNAQAREGLQRIAGHYKQLAEEALAQGRDNAARQHIQFGLSAVPDYSPLLELQRRLEP
jgi:serine/threonine-protein kinase